MNEQLSIYYCMDVGSGNFDVSNLVKCVEVYLKVKMPQYKIACFTEYKSNVQEPDCIQRGIQVFNNMFNDLKLKHSHETWFLYITSGRLHNINMNKDVGIMLLYKSTNEHRCYYVINKHHTFDIKVNDDKSTKLQTFKHVSNSLEELLRTNNTIRIHFSF